MRLILLLTCAFVASETQGKTWSVWNHEGTRRFGFVQRSLPQEEAVKLCQSANFDNLLTIRDRKELLNLQETIHNYEFVKTGRINFSTGKKFFYWLGTKESAVTYYRKRPQKWFNYDKSEARFFEWFPGFPTRFSGPSCPIIVRGCRRGCWVKWQNRPCSSHDNIDLVICESRENRTTIEEVERMANASADKNKPLTADKINKIVDKLYKASRQSSDDPSIVGSAERTLKVLSSAINNEEVSENTVRKFLKTVQIYDDIAVQPNSNVTVHHREAVVKTLENFLNRVNISKPRVSVKFNTTSITAEIRYLGGSTSELQRFEGHNGCSIVVSADAIQRVDNVRGVGNKSRLSFVSYADNGLFSSKHTPLQIVSATINGQNINGLKDPVTYSMPLSDLKTYDVPFVQCASWNFSTSSWSQEGCWLQVRNSTPVCACNHMTNFALLVELFQRPKYVTFDEVNRYIGVLSCVGFFLVVIIYVSCKELRNSRPGPVHINLCLCYGLGYLIFLTGSEYTEDERACLSVTILCHYFFLTGWVWTFMEALTMYQLLVRKSKFLKENYHFYIFCASYTFPLIVVALNVGLAVGYVDKLPADGFYRLNGFGSYNSSYVSNYACWLTSYSLYFGFLSVGGIVFGLNIIIYVIVLRSITWERKKVSSTRKRWSSSETFWRAVTIGVLFGLVWLIAVPLELLAFQKVLIEPVTYLFSTLIALQGIVVFYIFCIRPRKARRLWLDPILNCFIKYTCFKYCCKRRSSNRFSSGSSYDLSLRRRNRSSKFNGTISTTSSIYYSSKRDRANRNSTASYEDPKK